MTMGDLSIDIEGDMEVSHEQISLITVTTTPLNSNQDREKKRKTLDRSCKNQNSMAEQESQRKGKTLSDDNSQPTQPKQKKQRKNASNTKGSEFISGPFTLFRKCEHTADWDDFLMDPRAVESVCPVDYFPHAPFSSIWKAFAKVGMKIELEHPQSVGDIPVYSVATILAFAGYKAFVKFERLKNSEKSDTEPSVKTWISFCSSIPKPYGFSLKNKHLLLPVQGPSSSTHTNLKELNEQFIQQEFGSSNFSEVPTISEDHEGIIRAEVDRIQRRAQINKIVEVLDPDNPTSIRLGVVRSITGDRLEIKFEDQVHQDQRRSPRMKNVGVFLHTESELIYPFGTSHTIGLEMKPSAVASPTLTKKHFPFIPPKLKDAERMCFEVRHPIIGEYIMAGYVKRALKYGYFLVQIILPGDKTPGPESQFILHITSEYLLPCGFCETHGIDLNGPEDFSWNEYFQKENNASRLDLTNLSQRPPHKFEKGQKFEAIDTGDTSYLGPATVMHVAEHLLYIHFDGWSTDIPQSTLWISAFSPDIYPAGYAELVGHEFKSQPTIPKASRKLSRKK